MAISVASRKSKGRALQQFVRDSIIDLLKPYGVVADDVRSTSMGASGEDVQLSPLAKRLLPVSVECKSHKAMAIYTWWSQCLSNTKAGERPLLVIKINQKKPLAVMDYQDYIELERVRLKHDKVP